MFMHKQARYQCVGIVLVKVADGDLQRQRDKEEARRVVLFSPWRYLYSGHDVRSRRE